MNESDFRIRFACDSRALHNGLKAAKEENGYSIALAAVRALSEHKARRDPCRKWGPSVAVVRKSSGQIPEHVTAMTAAGRAWIAATAAEAERRGLLWRPVVDPYAPAQSAQPPRSGKKDWQPTVV